MKRERERQEGVKMISYVAHVPLDKGVCVCVQFPFIAYLTHITGCLSASVQSKKLYFVDYFIRLIFYINIIFLLPIELNSLRADLAPFFFTPKGKINQ